MSVASEGSVVLSAGPEVSIQKKDSVELPVKSALLRQVNDDVDSSTASAILPPKDPPALVVGVRSFASEKDQRE